MERLNFVTIAVILFAATSIATQVQSDPPPRDYGDREYRSGRDHSYTHHPLSQRRIDEEIAAMTRDLERRREDYRRSIEDRHDNLTRHIEMMEKDYQRYVEDYRREVEERYKALDEEIKRMQEDHNARVSSYRLDIEERATALEETLQRMQKNDEDRIADHRNWLEKRLQDFGKSAEENVATKH